MPKDVEYRLLERFEDGGWAGFGVVYRRGDRIVLFTPGMRSQQELPVSDLSDLTSNQFPSADQTFRWGETQTCADSVDHPVGLLEHALRVRQKRQTAVSPSSLVEKMRAALTGLTPSMARSEGGVARSRSDAEVRKTLDRLALLAKDDADLAKAIGDIETAFFDPEVRPKLLEALSLFARAARRE